MYVIPDTEASWVWNNLLDGPDSLVGHATKHYRPGTNQQARLFCVVNGQKVLESREKLRTEVPCFLSLCEILIAEKVLATQLCMALTYEFDGHGDMRAHMPVTSQEGKFYSTEEKKQRSENPNKGHCEVGIATGGAGEFVHFNVDIQPHEAFSKKTALDKACGLVHVTEMPPGTFRAFPDSVHGVSSTLEVDGQDCVARPRREGEAVALHAARGVGALGVVSTMLCTLPPERCANTLQKICAEANRLRMAGLMGGPCSLEAFAVGSEFHLVTFHKYMVSMTNPSYGCTSEEWSAKLVLSPGGNRKDQKDLDFLREQRWEVIVPTTESPENFIIHSPGGRRGQLMGNRKSWKRYSRKSALSEARRRLEKIENSPAPTTGATLFGFNFVPLSK